MAPERPAARPLAREMRAIAMGGTDRAPAAAVAARRARSMSAPVELQRLLERPVYRTSERGVRPRIRDRVLRETIPL